MTLPSAPDHPVDCGCDECEAWADAVRADFTSHLSARLLELIPPLIPTSETAVSPALYRAVVERRLAEYERMGGLPALLLDFEPAAPIYIQPPPRKSTTMTEEILFPDTPFPLEPSLVLLGRRGSESHGTYVPSTDPNSIDDRDLMGICIPPTPWTLGLRSWEGAESIKGVWDVVLYDFRKFVRLLCKQNPNVIGMLWLEPEDYLHVGEAGCLLIENRDLFRVRDAAYDTFVGYAQSQLSKMQKLSFDGYMGQKRKQLVEKYGYDTKNAAHLIRLLHMGEEFLLTGKMRVSQRRYLLITREDAESIATLLGSHKGADAKRIVDRFKADTGGDFEEIATRLKKQELCGACVIEGQSHYCMSLDAQKLGRRLQRLIDRALPNEGGDA